MYLIVITEPAELDIQDAVKYIAVELHNRIAAAQLLDDVDKAISSLEEIAFRYALVDDEVLASSFIRFFPVRNYLVFYVIREEIKTVVIERVLYGRRDWTTILQSKNKSE